METEEAKKFKFTAIKLQGNPEWVWFRQENVRVDEFHYIHGTFGWGKNGTKTNITVKTELIEGQIWSDELQYK
jgi:hypothetical protein